MAKRRPNPKYLEYLNRELLEDEARFEERSEELEDLQQAEIDNLEVINDGLRESQTLTLMQRVVVKTATLFI